MEEVKTVNYWLWLEERQERVREAIAVAGRPSVRRTRSRRFPRLLAVRTVPPGRSDAMQPACPDVGVREAPA